MSTRSIQPRRQRKAVFTADHQERRRRMAVPLSRELRTRYGRRSLPVRKGDTVRVLAGSYSTVGEERRVARVDREHYRLTLDNVTTKTADDARGEAMTFRLKRGAAPRSWTIPRKGTKWVKRPAPGPHAQDAAIPILLVLRDVRKLVSSAREARILLRQGSVRVDGRVVKDLAWGVGLFDTISLD